MGSVFFSYAEEDSKIASLIYEDMEQVDLDVWSYQIDGVIGALIFDELKEEITKAQYFCLLDSPHSRKSDFVRKECQMAKEVGSVRNDFRMIICLLEKVGDWRSEELFPGQNDLAAIDFTDYENGRFELYNALGECTLYKARALGLSLPRDKDFRIEIKKCNLLLKHQRDLNTLYRAFRRSYDGDKPDITDAEQRLKILIEECEAHGVNMITLRIAQGVLQADSGRDEVALKIFSTITRQFENDPRGWAGVGAAQFYLFNYESAWQAYEHCHRLVLESTSAEHQSHLMEVVHNKVRVLLALGYLDRALGEINGLPETHQRHNCIRHLRGEILMKQGEWPQAISCLKAAYHRAANPAIILDLAECYRMVANRQMEYEILQLGLKSFPEDTEILENLSCYYWEAGHPFTAISYLQKAVSLSPESIKYKVELALLLRRTGDKPGFYNEVLECTNLYARSSLDHYYLGYAFYLLQEFARAREEYKAAKKDRLTKDWPYYEEAVVANLTCLTRLVSSLISWSKRILISAWRNCVSTLTNSSKRKFHR